MTVIGPKATSADDMRVRLDIIEEYLEASRAFLSTRMPGALRRAESLLRSAEAELMDVALHATPDAPRATRLLAMCDELGGSLLAAAVVEDAGASVGASAQILARAAERITLGLRHH